MEVRQLDWAAGESSVGHRADPSSVCRTLDHGAHGEAAAREWNSAPHHAAEPLGRDGRRSCPLDRQHDGRVRHRCQQPRPLRLLGARASFTPRSSGLCFSDLHLLEQFTATQGLTLGLTLSPMFFLNPAILSRAGLYTVGALGGSSSGKCVSWVHTDRSGVH